MDVAIRSIARLYRWSVDKIEKLYLDDIDYKGLYYWYKDALEYNEQIKNG